MSAATGSPLRRAFSWEGRPRALGAAALLLVGVFAYRALLLDALRPPTSPEFEQWFFTPEQRSPLLPLGVALWMLVRRRARLRALPDRAAPGLVAALLALGGVCFAWACLAGASSLLLPSLAANLLAFVGAQKGRAGCRSALLPALLLLLGTRIPVPLRDEIVWWLQVSSARGAAWLLESAGADVVLAGVQIHSGNYAFTVIETCSGLRGIEILTLIAFVIRELFAAAGWRSWIVVAIAAPLGFALNLVRIAAVVGLTAGDVVEGIPPEGLEHTPQGMAVLFAGTALLYLFGRGLAPSLSSAARAGDERVDESRRSSPAPRRGWGAGALLVLAVLATFSLVAPALPRIALPAPIELPVEQAGWSGEELMPDRVFIGQFTQGQVLYRRSHAEARGQAPRVVDLLVGYEAIENPSSRLLSPKLLVPEHDWSLAEVRPARIWLLGLDAQLAVASRDSELMFGYLWRLRDEGIWRETWRAALSLDVGPLRREGRRVVVRLTTPLEKDGPVARDRAKRTLDRFVSDFRNELAGL
ncbi:MAG: exosortase/archaeosortase family protein [Myxococcales bacterium]|nr:MAG: exosortase/archaeosortase family protein [Myxococcales bacterium]